MSASSCDYNTMSRLKHTAEEDDLVKVSTHIFSASQCLEFEMMRKNLFKKHEAIKHNQDINKLKELADKYGVSSKVIKDLKDMVIPYC